MGITIEWREEESELKEPETCPCKFNCLVLFVWSHATLCQQSRRSHDQLSSIDWSTDLYLLSLLLYHYLNGLDVSESLKIYWWCCPSQDWGRYTPRNGSQQYAGPSATSMTGEQILFVCLISATHKFSRNIAICALMVETFGCATAAHVWSAPNTSPCPEAPIWTIPFFFASHVICGIFLNPRPIT